MIAGKLLEEAYREIHADILNGVVTSGTTTTLLDSSANGKYQTSKFKNWTLFMSRTTDAGSPQGRWAIISASVSNPFSVTFPTITDAPAAGDEYALCKDVVPLYEAVKQCSRGLRKLGRIINTWDRSLTTADDTLRYTLPAGIKGIRPNLIQLEDSVYNPLGVPNWHIEASAGETQDTLVFEAQPVAAYTLAINYMGFHPELTAYNTAVNGIIPEPVAIAACVERMLWWKAMPRRRKIDMENWNTAKALLTESIQDNKFEVPFFEEQHPPLTMYN